MPRGRWRQAVVAAGLLVAIMAAPAHSAEPGVYTLWDNTVSLHVALYGGQTRDTRNSLGETPLSAPVVGLHGDQRNTASAFLLGANRGTVDTVRAELFSGLVASWMPAVQYFQTSGATTPTYFGLPAPAPKSAGFVGELAFVPWGKPDDRLQSGNMRLALQYVAYTQFNGSGTRASDNNALFFSLWAAFHF